MPDRTPRKDRLIQTRVPRELEVSLKDEARRRRLTVSQLIRTVLEDALELVDGVVADVDEIVGDSVRLASNVRRSVRRNARRLVSPGRERLARSERTGPAALPADAFPDVYAWSELVLHRAAACDHCARALERGERGFFGLAETGGPPRACLCPRCVDALRP